MSRDTDAADSEPEDRTPTWRSEPAQGGDPSSVGERAGDRIGPYRLIERIGEGGFGTVWLAEQDQPIRRQVALKIIKPGMDSREVIARFEQERQALALMDHPNIAKVLEAGTTATGRPFFAMEWIKGTRITEFCDERRLTTEERLHLFMSVCQAVQHAHQKGVIHRDLKPSNVLVAELDGVATPKVIDFGVAKAMQQPLTDKTLATAVDQIVGTPLYMSPEQVAGNLDIDTRSDLYALGMLLYELLTGRMPFARGDLARAGIDAIRRAILEQEPRKPSTALETLGDGDIEEAARRRRVPATRLLKTIRGDLDWIVLKAMDKDRARRYDSPSALAEDLRRHLANEPVTACPPSVSYRLRRLIRRNRFAFAAVAAILLTLFIGLAASLHLYLRERTARHLAERAEQDARAEAARTEQVVQLMREMLGGAVTAIAQGHDPTMMKDILDRTAVGLEGRLQHQPELHADMRLFIANVYLDLGLPEEAEHHGREALRLATLTRGRTNALAAMALERLANTLCQRGQLAEAETLALSSLQMREALCGPSHADTAQSLLTLGLVFAMGDKRESRHAVYRRADAILDQLGGEGYLLSARARDDSGRLFVLQRKFAEAEADTRESLDILLRHTSREDPAVLRGYRHLSNVLFSRGKFEESDQALRAELAIAQKLYGEEAPEVAEALYRLSVNLTSMKRIQEAAPLIQRSLEISRKLHKDGTEEFASRTEQLALVEYLEGRFAEAETHLREAIDIWMRTRGPTHQTTVRAKLALVKVLDRTGRPQEKEQLLASLPSTVKAANQSLVVAALRTSTELLAQKGQWKDAAAEYGRLIAADPTDHWSYHACAALLAIAGDLDGFRRNRSLALTRFADTTDPVHAERMAKAALLIAAGISSQELAAAAALAERAVGVSPTTATYRYHTFTKGLSDYRQGHFESATNALGRTLVGTSTNALLWPQTLALIAMADACSTNLAGARAALAQAERMTAAKRHSPTEGHAGSSWYDEVVTELLLHEARTTVAKFVTASEDRAPAVQADGSM